MRWRIIVIQNDEFFSKDDYRLRLYRLSKPDELSLSKYPHCSKRLRIDVYILEQ